MYSFGDIQQVAGDLLGVPSHAYDMRDRLRRCYVDVVDVARRKDLHTGGTV
jgi:hypothetical protein